MNQNNIDFFDDDLSDAEFYKLMGMENPDSDSQNNSTINDTSNSFNIKHQYSTSPIMKSWVTAAALALILSLLSFLSTSVA